MGCPRRLPGGIDEGTGGVLLAARPGRRRTPRAGCNGLIRLGEDRPGNVHEVTLEELRDRPPDVGTGRAAGLPASDALDVARGRQARVHALERYGLQRFLSDWAECWQRVAP